MNNFSSLSFHYNLIMKETGFNDQLTFNQTKGGVLKTMTKRIKPYR